MTVPPGSGLLLGACAQGAPGLRAPLFGLSPAVAATGAVRARHLSHLWGKAASNLIKPKEYRIATTISTRTKETIDDQCADFFHGCVHRA